MRKLLFLSLISACLLIPIPTVADQPARNACQQLPGKIAQAEHSARSQSVLIAQVQNQMRGPSRRLSQPREQSSSGSTRIRGRSIKGLVKLGIIILVVLFGVGGWVISKLTGTLEA